MGPRRRALATGHSERAGPPAMGWLVARRCWRAGGGGLEVDRSTARERPQAGGLGLAVGARLADKLGVTARSRGMNGGLNHLPEGCERVAATRIGHKYALSDASGDARSCDQAAAWLLRITRFYVRCNSLRARACKRWAERRLRWPETKAVGVLAGAGWMLAGSW